ncbi:cytochrome c oxidase subunit II [Metabacillus sp. FJAT-53654]|uniref:Cytochrome aa3 subunit 2 n=1 Tax=Metabacillus rhizosphaerae TaxID=3117747 RepID=A0ABZ2MXP3_9BACI
MHIHKYEKIWLGFGIFSLVLFLSIIGVTAFAFNHHPAGGMETIDPEKLEQTAPFDHPGVHQIDQDTYEVVIVAKTFGYDPPEIKVPTGKKIIFKVASADVSHSFSIVNTNVNMMVIPGQINTKEYTFDKPGQYLVICNEYCGTGHHFMKTSIEVIE